MTAGPGQARLRIAVVGPTHPYTGGISTHTTALAHRLAAAGHHVEIVSWSAQYPGVFYPGTARVPWDRPEVVPFPRTSYPLAWYRPDSWYREGTRLRSHDVVVVVAVTPFHAVPYDVLTRAVRPGPRTVAVVHNVLPHEQGPLDRPLMRRLLRVVDAVVVHSEAQRRLALELGAAAGRTSVAPLTLPLGTGGPTGAALGAVPRAPRPAGGPLELLFFGTVRPYKGLDVLLRALARVPDARLVVAGDFWEPVERYRALAAELGVTDRVELRVGYVAEEDIPALFGAADVLVLPYRSGTATVNVALAAVHGLPVVTTDAGTLADEVQHDVDGLVVPAFDVEALAAALRTVSERDVLARLTEGVRVRDTDASWDTYVDELLRAASPR
jgi:D-inositol-3-phosphate glycosyltransferase